MSGELCLIHLVWEPLGPERLASFGDSYRLHPAGVEHRLVVLLNGFSDHQDLSPWRRALGDVAHEELRLTRARAGPRRLPAGGRAASRRALLLRELLRRDPPRRLAGADRSAPVRSRCGDRRRERLAESAYSAAPRPLRPFRRDFDPFPNPHIRTNAFAIRGELLRSLEWPAPSAQAPGAAAGERAAGHLRQVRDRGLGLLVVGADGVAYAAGALAGERAPTAAGGDQRARRSSPTIASAGQYLDAAGPGRAAPAFS